MYSDLPSIYIGLIAQVMYAYVMGPQTLPHSYWQFIVKSGPVSAVVLEAVRRNNRGLPVDVDAVNKCGWGQGQVQGKGQE